MVPVFISTTENTTIQLILKLSQAADPHVLSDIVRIDGFHLTCSYTDVLGKSMRH